MTTHTALTPRQPIPFSGVLTVRPNALASAIADKALDALMSPREGGACYSLTPTPSNYDPNYLPTRDTRESFILA